MAGVGLDGHWEGRHGLSSTQLKWIAVITMLVDHIGASLLEWHLRFVPAGQSRELLVALDVVMRCIGRMSFPLFIFLLVEGFFYTRSRARYLGRLTLFALVSELPFDLAFFVWRSDVSRGTWMHWEYQNVFLTLAIGFCVMWAMEALRPHAEERAGERLLRVLGCAAAVAAGCWLASFARSDYSWHGVLAIAVAYLMRLGDVRRLEPMAICLVLALIGPFEYPAFFACLPAWFYDGTRGRGGGKWFFYLFYPGHLLVLGILRILLVLPT